MHGLSNYPCKQHWGAAEARFRLAWVGQPLRSTTMTAQQGNVQWAVRFVWDKEGYTAAKLVNWPNLVGCHVCCAGGGP